jgi:hypothetical protein
MHASFTLRVCALWLVLVEPSPLWAGMPKILMNDVARMRVQSISFFLAGFVAAAYLVKMLWNYLRKDWTFLPPLGFGRALVVVGLWGLLFILVLTMISGARELMTPGAWKQEGQTYRLVDRSVTSVHELEERRRRGLEELRDALRDYARSHEGRFPADSADAAIPARLWKVPEAGEIRYVYAGGPPGAKVLAFEPEVHGGQRYLLFANGDIRKMGGDEIAKLLAEGSR